MSRDIIKSMIKSIKKFDKEKYEMQRSETVLTFNDIKYMLKKVKNLPEKKARAVYRRLSMNKSTIVTFEELVFWLKPWPKISEPQPAPTRTLFDQL